MYILHLGEKGKLKEKVTKSITQVYLHIALGPTTSRHHKLIEFR